MCQLNSLNDAYVSDEVADNVAAEVSSSPIRVNLTFSHNSGAEISLDIVCSTMKDCMLMM